MARMTPTQRAHLEKKISELYGYTQRQAAREKFRKAEPAAVVKARQVVKDFDNLQRERDKIVDAAFDKAQYAAKEAILFMEPTEALEYVNALKPVKVG